METGPNSILLKKSEESRLDELFNNFARTVILILIINNQLQYIIIGREKLEI